jgi:DNA polymerase-3 subunit beta
MSSPGFQLLCKLEDLLLALATADAVVPTNSAKPILTNLQLVAKDDRLEINATDMQVGLRATVRRLEIIRAGEVVLPARQLVGILKASRSPSLSLALESDGSHATVVIDLSDGCYRLPAVIGEAFPETSAFPDEGLRLELPVASLQTMIGKTAFAADRERSSAVLTGILLSGRGHEVAMAATDGKVLGEQVAKTTSELGDDGFQAILPAGTINHISRILSSGAKGDATIMLTGKVLFLRCLVGEEDAKVQVELSSRLIDGVYPPYRNALPMSGGTPVIFQSEELASAVHRTALMTSTSSRAIVLELSPDGAQLSNLFVSSGSARIPVACTYAGAPQRIGLNAHYLGEVLKVFESDEVRLELYGPGKGIIIREPGATFLVMPITLPN